MVWWIGHDLITGPWAFDAAKMFGGRVAIVHHMDYDAYRPLQFEGDANDVKEQKRILASADVILAVGPKLFDSARDKVLDRQGAHIAELIPGLPRVRALPSPGRFQAITMGRFGLKNEVIKQAGLAAAAFGTAIGGRPDDFGLDPALTLLGIDENELVTRRHEFPVEVERLAGRAVPVIVRGYDEGRTDILDELRRYSVAMMLSTHEGFGLVGWEAIGAAVPLITSVNSGLYQTVDRYFSGAGTGCLEAIEIHASVTAPHYRDEDVRAVSNALCRIARRPTRAKDNALQLKSLVEQRFSWQGAAAAFCAALNLRTLRLSRWSSEYTFELPNTYSAATRRELEFRALWDGLKHPSRFRRCILLFGGISTALSDERAFSNYAEWLLNNPSAELFICYESGPAALARARELDPDEIEEAATLDLPREPTARMQQKEQHITEFCNRLAWLLDGRDSSTAKRFGHLRVCEGLSTYVMIADDEFYLTPLMSRRSSETLTLRVAEESRQFKIDVMMYIIHTLEKQEGDEVADRVVRYLKTLIDTISARSERDQA